MGLAHSQYFACGIKFLERIANFLAGLVRVLVANDEHVKDLFFHQTKGVGLRNRAHHFTSSSSQHRSPELRQIKVRRTNHRTTEGHGSKDAENREDVPGRAESFDGVGDSGREKCTPLRRTTLVFMAEYLITLA